MLTSVANAEPGKKPVFGFNAATLARHFFRHVWMAMRGEWHRFGYTCVSFGVPVSLRNYVEAREIDFRVLAPEPRRIEVERLGNELMEAVGRVVPALPVSLVATAMLEAGDQPLIAVRNQGPRFESDRRPRTARKLCSHPARRPRLRHLRRPADADAAPSGDRDRRHLPRQPERAACCCSTTRTRSSICSRTGNRGLR